MKLKQFRAKNFRCLYDPGWIILKDPTVLIGCNDGGKTATIEALDYFFSNTPPPLDAYSYVPNEPPDGEGNRPRESEIILEAVLTLSEQDKDLLQDILLSPPTDSIHIRKIFKREDSSISFDMKTDAPQDRDLPEDVMSLSIGQIRECMEKYKIPNPGGTLKEPLQEALKQWLRAQPMEERWIPVPTVIIDALPLFQLVEGEDPESTILQILNVTYRQLLKEPETQRLLASFNADFDKQLRQPLEEKTHTLANYVQRYLPDIVEARVRPQFQVNARLESAPLTLVGKEGARIDLSARGAGTRQQVNLAVFEWSSETMEPENGDETTHTILAFDEPDLHLDYEAQKRIYGAIESYLAKGVQLIVATHSINFINRVPIECIYHYSKPTGELKATIECLCPSTEDPEEAVFFIDRLGESMGFDNATILYERCFLAFEGSTERVALPILFKTYTGDTLLRKGIRLVNCYDAYGAIVFAKFVHRNGRPVVFLVDEDTTVNKGTRRHLTTSALEKAGFSITEQVHLVGPACFEFAFSDELWARVLNENQPDGKQNWTSTKVAPYRTDARGFIDQMAKLLQEDSKPRIGLMIAKAIQNVDEIPLVIRQCFDNAITKANH